MLIAYESKTGFTKKYADMLALKTGLKAVRVNELPKNCREEIIFLGWLKAGRIQGINKARKCMMRAVCASGTASTAEPDTETVVARNNIANMPFFYLRGGCLPLRELKGMDKFMLTVFLKMLKRRKDADEKTRESISIIENGFDGVREENLEPLLKWLKSK